MEVATAGDVLLLPSGRAVVTSSGDGARLVALADDGTTTRLEAPAPGPGSAVNPDGTAVVGAGGSPELVMIAADGSVVGRGALPVPHDDGQEWVVAGWESTTDVVLRDTGSGKGLSLVRCSTEADRCERVRTDGVQAVAD